MPCLSAFLPKTPFRALTIITLLYTVTALITVAHCTTAGAQQLAPIVNAAQETHTPKNIHKKSVHSSLAIADGSATKAYTEASRATTKAASSPGTPLPPPAIDEVKHYILEDTKRYSIHAEYPSTGASLVDQDIAHWVRQQVNVFTDGVSSIPPNDPSHFVLNITYERTQPSLRCASFVFFITTDTGNATPEMGLTSFTYYVQEGRLLGMKDLFLSPEGLIPYFSTFCRKELNFREWKIPELAQINVGTIPIEDNFSSFAVSANGLDLYFPPSQVASQADGVVKVSIPLKELKQFNPNYALWGYTKPLAPSNAKD